MLYLHVFARRLHHYMNLNTLNHANLGGKAGKTHALIPFQFRIPSRELTYPPKMAWLKMIFLFPFGGICQFSLEGTPPISRMGGCHWVFAKLPAKGTYSSSCVVLVAITFRKVPGWPWDVKKLPCFGHFFLAKPIWVYFKWYMYFILK